MILCFLGFVGSHPFAGKKAKGWGTGQVQDHAVRGLVRPRFSAWNFAETNVQIVEVAGYLNWDLLVNVAARRLWRRGGGIRLAAGVVRILRAGDLKNVAAFGDILK